MKKKTAVAAVVMSTAVMLSGASALAEDAGRTVGINSWVAGAYALDILANNAQYAVEANGDETLVFNDEGNVEKLTSNVENMISANVDGALWMGMFENMFAVGPSLLENAGIPFALYDKVPSDQGMIDAVNAGSLTLEKLEAMTCVCSVGLDMIAIPGDTKAETISGIIADEMAIGMINQKTTAVRLIPVIGKDVGDTVEFGGLLGYAPIMPVNSFSCDEFVNRGGRIPAPIHSFKN